MWIQPQARLDVEHLNKMSGKEVLAFFAPHLKQQTAVLPPPLPGARVVHWFPALHSRRPACGRRLPFEPSDASFSRAHATCPGCLEAAREAA